VEQHQKLATKTGEQARRIDNLAFGIVTAGLRFICRFEFVIAPFPYLLSVGANPSAILVSVPTLHLKEQSGNKNNSLLFLSAVFCAFLAPVNP
jgi:hypothetical protein